MTDLLQLVQNEISPGLVVVASRGLLGRGIHLGKEQTQSDQISEKLNFRRSLKFLRLSF